MLTFDSVFPAFRTIQEAAASARAARTPDEFDQAHELFCEGMDALMIQEAAYFADS